MGHHRMLATGLLATALSACTVNPPATQRPEPPRFHATACVTALDQLPVRPLPQPRNAKVARQLKPWPFAAHAACIDPSQRPYALYEIGPFEPPALIEVSFSEHQGSTFAGQASLLDADFHRLAHLSFDRFQRRGLSFTATMFVNETERIAHYLLIQPDEGWVGRLATHIGADTFTTPIITPGVAFAINHGVERERTSTLSDDGRILVFLRPTN